MEYLTISGAQQEVKSTTIANRKRTTGRSLRLVFVAVLLNLFLMKKMITKKLMNTVIITTIAPVVA